MDALEKPLSLWWNRQVDTRLLTGWRRICDLFGDDGSLLLRFLPPLVSAKPKKGATPPGPGEGLVVRVNAVSVSPNATFSVTGFCPSGWFATGGGYQTNGMQVHTSKYSDSALGSGWTVTGLNLTPFSTGTVRVTVQCTPATNISAIDSAPGVVPPSP